MGSYRRGGGDSGRVREVADERPSEAVVPAIAETRGCDPTELPPLNDVLDPDALNDLFADTAGGHYRRDGHLTFEYTDCRVVVLGGEKVRVEVDD
jgi:hypothetical protein